VYKSIFIIKTPTIYILIHEKAKERMNIENQIYRKDFFVLLGRVYHVPKPARHIVMNEMIACKLLERVKGDNLLVL